MNLIQWINAKGALALYREWQENEITQIMMKGLLEMNSSARLQNPTGEQALQELGFRAGRDADIKVLMELDSFLQDAGGSDEGVEAAINYLVHTEGWSEEDASRIVNSGEKEEE